MTVSSGKAIKQALRSSCDVWCGVGRARDCYFGASCVFEDRRNVRFYKSEIKSYFLSLISAYSVE